MADNAVTFDHATTDRKHRVVVIGSGFGGLFAARGLRRAPVDLTLIGRTGHHLFQPLLYQVATGVLSQGEIAPATREILRRQANAQVLLGDVAEIDVAGRTVTSHTPWGAKVTPYDSLIVAAGAGQSYFGNDQFSEFAPGMKSIDDALELRGRIFGAFEIAELLQDPEQIQEWLTFVVIGAGRPGSRWPGRSPNWRTAPCVRTSATSIRPTPGCSCWTRPRRCSGSSVPSCRRRRRRS